ncbi:MAG TPA: recombinase family protein [Thermoleophilia bacterium]|nr:recombinase family protein [Thermoleophilia bacterium]
MGGTVAYMRVSSRAQDVATQRSAVERAAAGRGDTIEVWFSEKKSGKTVARPELDRLRAEVRAGRIGKLYLFKLDRLTRSGIRDTFEVIEELRAHGVQLVSVSDGFALDGPAAEVILAVIAWAAKMERLAVNERIAAARERLEAEGRPWGRPPRLSQAACVRLRALRDEGRSVRDIAVAMKVPRSTVARALARVAA